MALIYALLIPDVCLQFLLWGSKVIKGSFPVLSLKTSRIFISRTKHRGFFKFKLEQCILPVYMCIFFLRDQRSLKGSSGSYEVTIGTKNQHRQRAKVTVLTCWAYTNVQKSPR